jgi:prepilin-type N-terminal cleavage/methylation domain-containing protein
MQRGDAYDGQRGFTLVEVLAALAITSVIIAGTATLIHQVAFNFDRGARTMNRAETLALASDRLAGDFGAARFVVWPDDHAAAFDGNPAKIAFISAAGVGAGRSGASPPGEELVTLTVEDVNGLTQIVRRRAAWPGMQVHFADLEPGDSVVNIK